MVFVNKIDSVSKYHDLSMVQDFIFKLQVTAFKVGLVSTGQI